MISDLIWGGREKNQTPKEKGAIEVEKYETECK